MHRSGDIKTSMMSGIDRRIRRPNFLNNLPGPPGMTNAFGKQDFQQKYKSLPGISHDYNEFDEDETHDTTQVNVGYQEYAEGDASLYNTPGSRSNNGSSNGFPVQHVPKSTNRSVGENAKLGYNRVINDIGVSGDSRPGFRYQTNVQKRAKNVMENIIANTACVDRTFITGTGRDLSLYGKQSVIPGIPKKSQTQEENRNGIMNRNPPSCAVPTNHGMISGVNSETDATHTLYGEQPVTPYTHDYNEFGEDETNDTTQVNVGCQEYADGDANLYITPGSRSNNGSSNGFPVQHVPKSTNRSVGENAKLGYNTVKNDIGVGGDSRPGFRYQNNVQKRAKNAMENIIANTACVDRTFISGTVRDLSLYGKQSVIPGIPKKNQNQEENRNGTMNRNHTSCANSPNQSINSGVNSETDAKHTLYGEQPVTPGITRHTQNQDINCGMIKRVQSSYALPTNSDLLLEMQINTTETPTEIEAIGVSETHSSYGKQSDLPGISKDSQNQDNLNHAMIKRVQSSYILSPNNDMLLEMKTDALQTQSELEAKRIVDTHSLYGKHSVLPGIPQNNPNEKNRCDEVIINAKSCYKLEPNPDTKLEMHTNGEEVNTEYADKHGTDVEKNVPDSYKELSNSEAASRKICNYESNQVDVSEGTDFIAIPQYNKEIVSSDKEKYTENQNASDAEASLNKDSKILVGHKDQKEEHIKESGPTVDTANDEASNSFHEGVQRVELDDSSDDNTTQEKLPSKEASIIRATVIVANPESVKRKHRKRRADREKKFCSSDDKNDFKEDSTNMTTESTSVNMKHENSSGETSFTKESSDTDDEIDKVPDDILDDDTNNTLDNLTHNKCKGNGSAETVIRTENEARLNHEKIHKEVLYTSKCDVKDNIDKSTQTIPKFFETRIVPDAMCLICKEQAAFPPLKVWGNEQTIKSKYMAKREKHNNDNKLEYKLAQNSKFNVATSKPTRSDVYMRIMNILETKIGPERAPDLMRSSTISDMLKNMDKNPMKYGFNYANFRDENMYMDINKLICDPTIAHADSATQPCFKQEQPRISLSNDNKPTLTVPESDRGCKDFCYSTYVGMEDDRNTRDMKDNNNMSDTSREVKANTDGGICCMDEDITSQCKIMKNCRSIKCKDNDQIPKIKQKKSSKIKAFFRSLMCICTPKTDNEYIDT